MWCRRRGVQTCDSQTTSNSWISRSRPPCADAHRLTTTYVMSELPAGWPRTPETAPLFPEGWLKSKGWPTFERAVSGMIKRGSDTSWRRIVDPAVPRGSEYQAPPMHPREFASELARKVFSDAADCNVVARLYANSFMGALGEARELKFSNLEWEDADVEAFAAVLPLLRRVEKLDLYASSIGERGFAALAVAIRKGAAPALKRFNFTGSDASTSLRDACQARGIAYSFFIRGGARRGEGPRVRARRLAGRGRGYNRGD